MGHVLRPVCADPSHLTGCHRPSAPPESEPPTVFPSCSIWVLLGPFVVIPPQLSVSSGLQTSSCCFWVRRIEESRNCISYGNKCGMLSACADSKTHTDSLDEIRCNNQHCDSEAELQFANLLNLFDKAVLHGAFVGLPVGPVLRYFAFIIHVTCGTVARRTLPSVGRICIGFA
jgi:hypothetical protein